MAYKLALYQVNCTTGLTGPTITLGLATLLYITNVCHHFCKKITITVLRTKFWEMFNKYTKILKITSFPSNVYSISLYAGTMTCNA